MLHVSARHGPVVVIVAEVVECDLLLGVVGAMCVVNRGVSGDEELLRTGALTGLRFTVGEGERVL